MLQFMVAYELLVSMAVNVALMIDGSEFSVVQVSPQQYLLANLLRVFLMYLQHLAGMLACQAKLNCNRAVLACVSWLLLSHADIVH